MFTIYAKIKRIADKVVTSYKTDITVHDKKALTNIQPSEVCFWTCRSHGSHMVWLKFTSDRANHKTLESTRNGLNYFDAVSNVFGNEDGVKDWYLLECVGKPRHGTVTKVTSDEARAMFVSRLGSLESAIYNKAA